MPLSEHEQRQLEAIERALYADDPKFAHTVRFTDPRSQARRRLVVGVALVLIGLGVVLGGVITGFWYVGVAGFLVMLLGGTRAYSGVKRLAGRGHAAHPGTRSPLAQRGPHGRGPAGRRRLFPSRGKGRSGHFVERFEERWRRRFDQP